MTSFISDGSLKALVDKLKNLATVDEAYHLDKVNNVEHYDDDPETKAFAKEYTTAKKGDYRTNETDKSRQSDGEKSDAFWDKYDHQSIRSGFAGSGTSVFTNKKTGQKFQVERHANGKTFYGTQHTVSKVK